MSGKKQDQSEKNLQQLFKEFYSDMQKYDYQSKIDSAKNSARSSLGSMSSTLEKRRQKLQQMKQDAMNIDKETPVEDKTKE